MPQPSPELRAVLFDKDGTLIDFHRTWDHAIGQAIRAAAPDEARAAQAADLLGFDLRADKILEGSVLIADSSDAIFELIEGVLDARVFGETAAAVSTQTVAPTVGMGEAIKDLAKRAIAMAVVTNDYASITVEQLHRLGWSSVFEEVVGSDSGFGAKPDPGMIHGTLSLLDVQADQAVMVGDTTHDMLAARAAGVMAVLVTNGRPNPRAQVMADHVIEDMTQLVPLLVAAERL